MEQPRNIFEQIMFALKSVNDNIVILSQNLAEVHRKVDALNIQPIEFNAPIVSGASAATEIE